MRWGQLLEGVCGGLGVMNKKKPPVVTVACGVVWRGKFIQFLLVPSSIGGSANLSIKTFPRIGPVLNRTVGHLASRIDEFSLLDF